MLIARLTEAVPNIIPVANMRSFRAWTRRHLDTVSQAVEKTQGQDDFNSVDKSDLTDAEKEALELFQSFAVELIDRKYARATAKVRERLASTMVRRRKNFIHVERRHAKQEKGKEKGKEKGRKKSKAPASPDVPTVAPRLTPFYTPEDIGATVYSTTDNVIFGGHGFLAASQDQQELEALDESVDYPPRPRASHPDCPFCSLPLSAKDVDTPADWR